MSVFEKQERPQAKPTPFNSPKPVITRMLNLIFGTIRPDIYTITTFFINLFIFIVFTLWEVLSLVAISSRELIWQKKNIPIEAIINDRGEALGFERGQFLSYLITTHSIGLICWLVFFAGLVMLYRKKQRFIYFTFIPLLFYVGMLIFYLNFTYFVEDTTVFDKIALLVSASSLIIQYFLMRSERAHGTINFFGLSETDEADETAH